jgi:hypothetical protein
VKIDEDLAAIAAFSEADQFADVRKHVDPRWVRDALGKQRGRRRYGGVGCRRSRWCGW